MPKTKISDFSTTAGNNTDINSINIAEGCAPSGINDAIRTLMAYLKDWQSGAVAQDNSFNGAVTISGNAVLSANLTASGNVGIGTSSPTVKLDVRGNASFSGNATARQTADFTNTGAQLYVGAESSAGGAVFTGSSAYAGIIGTNTNTPLQLGTNGTIKTTLDSAGNLGLGVVPSAWGASEYRAVQVGNGASFYGRFAAGDQDKAGISSNAFNNGTNWLYIATDSAANYTQIGGGHFWYTAPSGTAGNAITFTQAMTLDASGNLGIGATSPGVKLDVSGGSIRVNEDGVGTKILTLRSDFASLGPAINVTTSNPLLFLTNNTERMRIDSSGNLLVGTTDPALTTGNGIKAVTSGTPYLLVNTSGSTSATTSLLVYSTGASAYRFYVRNDGAIFATNTTIQSISDVQLKENVRSLDYGLAQIMELQPRRFDWKDGKGLDKKNDIGFIAQEFESVVPEFVDESIDTNEDGSNIKTVGAAGLIPILVKAIQEQQAIIEQLKADVAALKGKV
jgi:hypothetical protein